ncbi:MAG TPA: hypothetical protein VFE84_13585 [Patescibacteria group bacterium]|jgi:hypothetical protein|nr:hypothetical protein [Patescibacteria group bacterium]
MKTNKLLLASGLLVLAVVFAGCAKPPETEMKDAQASLEDARNTAQADKWASAEYQTAKTSLDNANAEVEAQNQRFSLMRNFDKAKEMFAQAKADAAKAKQAAVANKETAKNEANTKLQEATTAIQAARDALTKAPVTKDTRADIQLFTSDLDGLDQSLGEVRNMISSEDYTGASSKAATVTQQANDIATKLTEAAEKAASKKGMKKGK